MDTSLSRRSFLARSGLVTAGAGVLGVAGCTGTDGRGSATSQNPALPGQVDLSNWSNVRDQFALDPELAHFAAFVFASHPVPVRDAIERLRASLDADTASAVANEDQHHDETRQAAARYLAVQPEEIALTDSTTMGLGLVYHGLRLVPGDHILSTTHDFYSTQESLRFVAARSGAEVEQIALYDDPAAASVNEIVARLRAALRPTTKVVALTWVHSSTGVKLPVRQIADALAGGGGSEKPLLCLDAVHGLGAEDAQPATLGCDVFVSGTHKWLFGPRGTGLVWARREVWDRLSPIIPPFDGPSFVNWFNGTPGPAAFGLASTPGGFHSFEHRWALPAAFEFHLAIGKERVAARNRELATRLKEGLAGLSNVRLVTPRSAELSAGIVCCEVDGVRPDQAVATLRSKHRIVASQTPYRESYLRLGPSMVTSPEQVDAAVGAIASL